MIIASATMTNLYREYSSYQHQPIGGISTTLLQKKKKKEKEKETDKDNHKHASYSSQSIIFLYQNGISKV